MDTLQQAVVITVSDSCFRGARQDASGPAVAAALAQNGFAVDAVLVVPDEIEAIVAALRAQAARARLVAPTGGPGIARRVGTPAATRLVCDRILDGFGERMRSEGLKKTPFAPLSRAVCGTCRATSESGHTALILNLPGSPAGAVDSLNSVIGLIPHALALLAGDTEH